jgi:predicted  nucleic acid-binding Zn-ribbon protein
MKARFAAEEEEELRLMEEADAAEEAMRSAAVALDASRRRSAAEEPDLREELAAWQAELAEVEAGRDSVWAEVPQSAQVAYTRVRVRPVVVVVSGNQCSACRVQVTSSGMQLLRKGEVVHCENCGRILAPA